MSFFTESMIKRSQMLREWRIWARRVAAVARELIPCAEVYVVGSVVRGDYVGGSDVDVLVISAHVPEGLLERAKLKAIIEEELKLPYYHPFEIHMLKPEEAESYMRRARGRILRIDESEAELT